jgi:phosphoglycerate dehydrogenase-like enzyme
VLGLPSGAALGPEQPRLLTFPNVLITGHQAFFTAEALAGIAATTLENVTGFERGGPLHAVQPTGG